MIPVLSKPAMQPLKGTDTVWRMNGWGSEGELVSAEYVK